MAGLAQHVHGCFAETPTRTRGRGEREARADERRRRLLERCGEETAEALWRVRSYPILAALAPVITAPDNEIAWPGDPMCLYTALSVAVSRVVDSREAGLDFGPFDDLCPDWERFPSTAYRQGVAAAAAVAERNADSTVFDPRVWTPETRRRYVDELRRRRPRVLLVSTVSAGHRYALELARIAKHELPGCLVVLGGRHLDETTRWGPEGLELGYSSPIAAIADDRVAPVIDFVVSGDGAFALDVLLRAISSAMDLERKQAGVASVVEALVRLGDDEGPPPGRSLIVAIDRGRLDVFPVAGRDYDLSELPPAYRAFAIRARFPIFGSDDGVPPLTAHCLTASACPYRCSFCSESIAVSGRLRRFRSGAVEAVLERVCEYVHYGAESVFFDDSVFWAGNFAVAIDFCERLEAARTAHELPEPCRRWLRSDDDVRRLERLRWGAQFTVDLLTTVYDEERVTRLLDAARRVGCTYVYLGVESMAEEVMCTVHKNVSPDVPWAERVRLALRRIKDAGITTGSSVLFGLDGETRATIDYTIDAIGALVDEGLLDIVSPNILTYHPEAAITRGHRMEDRLDYHTQGVRNRAPYTFFEEAYPDVVSRLLTEDDIWHIHERAGERWGRYRNAETVELVEAISEADRVAAWR